MNNELLWLIAITLIFLLIEHTSLLINWVLTMRVHTRNPKRGNYVYAFRGKRESKKYLKIGRAKDPVQRLRTFQTANPNGVEVLGVWAVRDMVKAEKHVHWLLRSKHHRAEWFRSGPLVMTFIWATRSNYHTQRVRAALRRGTKNRAFV